MIVALQDELPLGGKTLFTFDFTDVAAGKHVPIETRAAPSSPNNLYLLDVAGGRRVSLTLLFHSAITSGGVLGAYAIATEMVQEDPEK